MYTIVRRYEGMSDAKEVTKRVAKGLVPIMSKVQGFISYQIVDTGSGIGLSISTFQDKTSADTAARAAATFVREQLADLLPNAPQSFAGDVLLEERK